MTDKTETKSGNELEPVRGVKAGPVARRFFKRLLGHDIPESNTNRRPALRRLRNGLIWIGAISMPFIYPVGLWLTGDGAINASRFLVVYWIVAGVWVASFTHWMLETPTELIEDS